MQIAKTEIEKRGGKIRFESNRQIDWKLLLKIFFLLFLNFIIVQFGILKKKFSPHAIRKKMIQIDSFIIQTE